METEQNTVCIARWVKYPTEEDYREEVVDEGMSVFADRHLALSCIEGLAYKMLINVKESWPKAQIDTITNFHTEESSATTETTLTIWTNEPHESAPGSGEFDPGGFLLAAFWYTVEPVRREVPE